MGVPLGGPQRPRFTDTPQVGKKKKYTQTGVIMHFKPDHLLKCGNQKSTCVRCGALVSTSVVAALLLVGTVVVIRAQLSAHP